jgi:hypothetical protein
VIHIGNLLEKLSCFALIHCFQVDTFAISEYSLTGLCCLIYLSSCDKCYLEYNLTFIVGEQGV